MDYFERNELPQLVDEALQVMLEKVNDAFRDGFEEKDIYFEGGPLEELARTLRQVRDKRKSKQVDETLSISPSSEIVPAPAATTQQQEMLREDVDVSDQ
jgi:hypothetical protein